LCLCRYIERVLKESGNTVENVNSESLEYYVMVQRSVVRRECNPGYLGESIEGSGASLKRSMGVDPVVLGVKPVIERNSSGSVPCGSQSLCSAVVVSAVVPVVTQFIPAVSVSSPELVSIPKRVPSNSEISRLMQHLQLKLYLIVVDVQVNLKISVVKIESS